MAKSGSMKVVSSNVPMASHSSLIIDEPGYQKGFKPVSPFDINRYFYIRNDITRSNFKLLIKASLVKEKIA